MSDANRHGRKETEPMPNVDKSTPQAICGAKTRSGAPCTQKPMRGQKRCRMHGGSSPNALAAAERRLAALDAARKVQERCQHHGCNEPGVVIVCATGHPLARYCHPHSAPKHPGGTR